MPRKYDVTVYTDDFHCQRCGNRFIATFKTRHPKYCPVCAPVVDHEQELERKRRYNERKRQERSQPTETARRGMGGGDEVRRRGEGPVTPSLKSRKSRPGSPDGGMFADLPRAEANEKRRRMGLPALAV